MTQQEYEQKKRECWEEFCRKFLPEAESEATMKDVIDFAFDRAYALGKQETKQETKQEIVIRGWVTFDDCIYECFLHTTKPVRKNVQIDDGVYQMEWRSEGLMYILDPNLFPDMDSDSEPQEVEIIIKRKKK